MSESELQHENYRLRRDKRALLANLDHWRRLSDLHDGVFEARAVDWVRKRVGEDHLTPAERAMRAVEEMLEFVQAVGVSEDLVVAAAKHVFSRKPGDARQEAGGVLVCMAGWCGVTGNSLVDVIAAEFERNDRKSDAEVRESLDRKASAGLLLPEQVRAEGPRPDRVAELEQENARLKEGLRSQAIAGTRHWFYAPCSKCGAIEGIGLSFRRDRPGTVAVWCCCCEHFGPTVEGRSREADRAAVMEWNAAFAAAFVAGQAAEAALSEMRERLAWVLRTAGTEDLQYVLSTACDQAEAEAAIDAAIAAEGAPDAAE